MKADLRARNFSEAFVSCATERVPPRDRAGSTLLRAWARSRVRRKSPESCPNEEIDRLYFFEAHRDGVIVAHILLLGAVQQASADWFAQKSEGIPFDHATASPNGRFR